MEPKILTEIAHILGVSEPSVAYLPEEIQDEMQAIVQSANIQDEEDQQAIYNALDEQWQKGNVWLALDDIADRTGIPKNTLHNLDSNSQQQILFEFLADSTRTEPVYEIVNRALAVIALDKVAKLLDVSVKELRQLPIAKQERLCGIYDMEFDEENAARLAAKLRREMQDV